MLSSWSTTTKYPRWPSTQVRIVYSFWLASFWNIQLTFYPFRLSANYYESRDPRREVAPPIDLTQNLLGSGYAIIECQSIRQTEITIFPTKKFLCENIWVCSSNNSYFFLVISVNQVLLKLEHESQASQHLVNLINGTKTHTNFLSIHVNIVKLMDALVIEINEFLI